MINIEKETLAVFNETVEILKQLENDTDSTNIKDFEFVLDQEVESEIQNLEDKFVQETLNKGLDLRLYSKDIEKNLKNIESNSIQDYVKEAKNIVFLHKEITLCDNILERIESMLNEFQSNLSSISSEIQSLQQQSVNMNIKLKNRQTIRCELTQFIDEMVITQTMIDNILETPVTERMFLEQLHELNHKINFVKEQSFRDAKACKDINEILDKLKIKSINKIREFIMQKIYQLRKPMANYQIIQNSLLKNRFFYEFLLANERNVSKECRDEYINTLSKIYYSYFKEYSCKITKLQFEDVAEKDDLLGAEDKPKTSLFSSKPVMKIRGTIFTLGNRAQILNNDLDASIIVPHASIKTEQKLSYECIFRTEQYALLDNSCREYLFICDFFMMQEKFAQDIFFMIFGKTLHLYHKNVENYMNNCFDAIAVFLCIHIIYKFQVISNKRSCNVLNSYYDTLLNTLWPRFEFIMQAHLNSIIDIDTTKLHTLDVRPHYITRRYAEFSGSLLIVNENCPNDKLITILSQLQQEVQNFILRLASEFSQRKEQLILLINNYDLILNVLTERVKDDSQEVLKLKELLNNRINEYVEEVLSPYFGNLIRFVKECEIIIDRGNIDSLKSYETISTQLIKNFSNDWKKFLDLINQEIMRTFTNFKNGQSILQATLTQIVQYYHRFQKVLSHNSFKQIGAKNELLNIHHLMVEIKKHKPNF